MAAEKRLRGLIPLLTVALSLSTALALLFTAAALTPPATSAPAVAPSAAPAATATTAWTLTTVARAEDVNVPPAPLFLGLARLLYAPGSDNPQRSLPGPLLLVVEAGALEADLNRAAKVVRADGATAAATGELLLHAGDSIQVADGVAVAFQNRGAMPAVALAAGVFAASAIPDPAARSLNPHVGAQQWLDAWSPGATVHPIAGGWLVNSLAAPANLALRRLNLAPGAQTALQTTDGMAIGLDAGVLTFAVTEGMAWRQPPSQPDNVVHPGSPATLLPGDGALFQDLGSATLRNDGSAPLQALILTVKPAGPTATPAAARTAG